MSFSYTDAKRGKTPLLVSLVGASFSGKTFSALRLASGVQRVIGGDIALIDTENGRANHYADKFRFKHVVFTAPFSPARYLEALEVCEKNGASVCIVDSGSHCWEGLGGVLEMHESELERMAGSDWKKRDRVNFAAWVKPKQDYTRLVNRMLQMPLHLIWCFRAKKKIQVKKGQDPIDLGYMSIAGTEMMYEFALQCLLYPGSGGTPTWNPELPGERVMAKLPSQFTSLFAEQRPLSEEIGEALARWAAGEVQPEPDEELFGTVLDRIAASDSEKEVGEVAAEYRSFAWTAEQREEIRHAIDTRRKSLVAAKAS